MSGLQRLRRLEALEREQRLREVGERVAAEFGVPVEETVRGLRETAVRIDRWGIDEELRRLARDHGLSEDDARGLRETAVRIDRWGIDEELRRLARDHGLSEDDARARFDEAVAELEEER